MKQKRVTAKRGRPRCFDESCALDRALQVFWRRGYQGASLPELTRAMGINRPSLYAAFGNKQQLFRRTLDRYAQGPARYIEEAMNEPTARRVAERLLAGVIDLVTDSKNPHGCLMVQAALTCGEESQGVQRELSARRESRVTQLRRRFMRAKTQGDLPASADPATLARYLATIMHGLAVQATGGATRAELRRVAQLALRAWPN